MDISTAFRSIGIQMEAELKKVRAATRHPGTKGNALESSVRTFLIQHLPTRFGVTTGTVVDANGGFSKQMDIIIYDAPNTPILSTDGMTHIIPIECVYAVIGQDGTDITHTQYHVG